MMRDWQRRGLAVAVGVVLLGGGRDTYAQTATAVPNLDHARYAGTWYEIARYPTKRSNRCVSDGTQLVAEGEKASQMQLVDACRTRSGFFDASNLTAKAKKKSVDGRLKITTLWPFSRKYWVLAVAPDYSWSLTGNPNHKELWIYARTATMDGAVLKDIEAKAEGMGYSSAKLMMMPQSGH